MILVAISSVVCAIGRRRRRRRVDAAANLRRLRRRKARTQLHQRHRLGVLALAGEGRVDEILLLLPAHHDGRRRRVGMLWLLLLMLLAVGLGVCEAWRLIVVLLSRYSWRRRSTEGRRAGLLGTAAKGSGFCLRRIVRVGFP